MTFFFAFKAVIGHNLIYVLVATSYRAAVNLHRQSDWSLIIFHYYPYIRQSFSVAISSSLCWRLCSVWLITATGIHLDQTNQRGRGAHQPHQPVRETSCPQEAGRHPVNGVTEVSHAAEDGQQLPSHLPAELRATAGENVWFNLS